MENNNYSNTENNNYNNTENNHQEAAGTANQKEAGNAPASQPESSSTYSYSYLNQEQKNPNNVWRAEENTAGSYAGGTYTGTQQDTGNTYTNAQQNTSHAYTGTQQNTSHAYTDAQQGNNSTYASAQQDTGNMYTNAQQDGNAYENTQQAGGAYSNAQPNYGGAYSNIYGNPNTQQGQAGWNTYSDAKKQKKEARAQKRAAKKANAPGSNFGIKLAKCASIALVFGLVAGTGFEGSRYVAGNLLGTDRKEAEATTDEKAGQEVLKIGDSAQGTTQLSSTPSNNSDGVVAIVEECMPSIVAITNISQMQYPNFFGQVQSVEVPSAGSGIIVSEDKDYLYIATNNHVVEAATSITIRFCDDATAAAEIRGTDVSTDLAVVQVKKDDIDAATLAAIKVATMGDSEKIKVGSQAIAIGNALGYGQSVTAGYISALEREVTMEDETTGNTFTNNLLQTDAAINRGNSGGALLNSSGEVIGINSSKYSGTDVEGMGFAIPSNTAKPIIEDLISKKEVSGDKAAYLGIHPETVTATVEQLYNMPKGVFVKEVYEDTAAEKYGIKVGDIITEIDGRQIQTAEALQSRLSYYEAGTQVEVVVQRQEQNGYEEVRLSVVLGKRES